MAPIVVLFVLANAAALLLLPRKWAAAPILIGACYMTRGQSIDIGFASFTVIRILILVGAVRFVLRGEWIRGGFTALDWLFVAWGLWMIASVYFHEDPESPFVLRVREVYDAWGMYFLFRVICQTREDALQLTRIVGGVLFPIALAMLFEKVTGANPFARFGDVPMFSLVRNGVVRAQGPFAHSILAGSIGGACLPLMLGIWRDNRFVASLGLVGCLGMVIASGSSGPILAAATGVGVLAMWPIRDRMRLVRWSIVGGYLALELVMNRPAYFIIADVDLMGGSTSWYRAELIRSALAHLDEWWLTGTDYTRHWMPSGVMSSPNQTDITNHYLAMGVVGGLVLMFLFIAMFFVAFWQIGAAMRKDQKSVFAVWSIGACLAAHAVTCLSVSYDDHSIIFLYLTFAAATASMALTASEPDPSPAARRQLRPARTFVPSSKSKGQMTRLAR